MKLRLHSLSLACALALGTAAVLVPAPAGAQESANDANPQYRKAFDALAQKNWAEARRLLLPLWQKARTWDVAAGLGQAEFLLQNRALGATYTAFALANLPPKEKTKTAERLRAALAEMKEAVATIHVTVSQDGAEIWVAGELVGTSPLARELYLDPGIHSIQARLESGAQSGQRLEVQAGKSYEVALSVDNPVDASHAGIAPATPASATPTAGIAPPPAAGDSGGRTWVPVFVTGGLAVAAAAIGTGFAVDARSAKADGAKALSEAEAQFGMNPCTASNGGGSEICQSLENAEDRRKSSNTVATVSFVVSGVFAVAAIGSYFLWAKPAAPRLDAWLGSESGGLSLKGNF